MLSKLRLQFISTILLRKQTSVLNVYAARCGRQLLSTKQSQSNCLVSAYEEAKRLCFSKKPPPDVDASFIFANNELHLGRVETFGFDYDYTLAAYRPELDTLIYRLGKRALVELFKYPAEVGDLEYLPEFAVRGLHYDIRKGLLLKVDSFNQIQLGSVFRGLTRVQDDEVLLMYGSTNLPINYIEPAPGVGEPSMVQLADLFSVPEMCLMCQVTELFRNHNIQFHPTVLFYDVKAAVSSIHPRMHVEVAREPGRYLQRSPELPRVLHRLSAERRNLFLITNSPYQFVHAGMEYLVGPDWRDLFDLVIVEAKKPKFFTRRSAPLRVYDPETRSKTWSPVTEIKKGLVYCEGTVRQMQRLTGWAGGSVLYFGDHPYTDLADVRLHHGWRTGAVIRELEYEIGILNTPEYKANNNWLQQLQQLIENKQDQLRLPENRQQWDLWTAERDRLRHYTKTIFNKQFGSLFRTHHNPTYFSRRLFHLCDVYTASVENLLDVNLLHTFYPRRGALPHEYRSMFI